MGKPTPEEIATALNWPAEEVEYLIQKLDRTGLTIDERRVTEGRGIYAHMGGQRGDFCRQVAHRLGTGVEQIMAEGAGRVVLGPIPWYVKADERVACAGVLGDFIYPIVVSTDGMPLVVTEPLEESAYLLVSHQSRPYYWMAGWAWGKDLVEAPGRSIEVEDLRSVGSLQLAVRARFGGETVLT